jgi:hypothetical protein
LFFGLSYLGSFPEAGMIVFQEPMWSKEEVSKVNGFNNPEEFGKAE